MACPITPVLGLGAAVGGAHTLFVQDHGHRRTTWTTSVALLGSWVAYGLFFREPGMRIALEVASVLALVVGGTRVWWLATRAGVRSPVWGRIDRGTRELWAVLGTPSVLVAKVWLLAMLVMEWRGKAHFGGLEYGTVTLAVLGLIALRVWRMVRLHRDARAPFATLESFASDAPTSACPLGFACTRTAEAEEPEALEAVR